MRYLNDIEDTKALARELVSLMPEKIICLSGSLGAGKTTLSQCIGQILNVEEYITSPTFAIHHIYQFKSDKGTEKLHHFDLYRLNFEDEFFEIGVDEILANNNYVIIEWPDSFMEWIPSNRVHINIKFDENNTRYVEIV